MKKISYVFSLIMVFVLSLGVFTVGSSKEASAYTITTNSAILDRLVGGTFAGPFYTLDMGNQYYMYLKVTKDNRGRYLASLDTYNVDYYLNPSSYRGTYNLSVSYNTSTAQYQLSGSRFSGSNSPASTVAIYGRLSGNTFYGYMISNNNAASRFNFNLKRIVRNDYNIYNNETVAPVVVPDTTQYPQ